MKKRIKNNIVILKKITNSILIIQTLIDYTLATYKIKTYNNNFITKDYVYEK